MKNSTRLDSAVFQLTPTRTRCDLVILANGKTEKIASGLVNPFLAHLKAAQDQMAKGGYSITLEPEAGSDASWFTKGTIGRFVRFVSTPEILERVYTLESEILQIEEAIAIQSNNDIGLTAEEGHQPKPVERIEGMRPTPDPSEEKAIVLYQPGAHPPEANGSTAQEGNSKVQLKKVLETRRSVLQKEQGMAFARAVAAGFDMDHMAPLVSFAESFGASRLMDACMRFMELWKRKHETGQWVEVEVAEAMSTQSDFSAMNSSGIILSNSFNRQWPETSDNGRASVGPPSADDKAPMDQQPPGQQQYFPGQFPQPMFPPWPVHSPPGAVPAFQGYPVQGIPYYQNYPGSSPFFQPPYPAGEDPRLNGGQRTRQRRHSMDSRDSNTETENGEVDGLKTRSQDDVEFERETSGSRDRKGSRSGKKQSGMVVIRNINYITSKTQDSSDSESQSVSGSEMDEEVGSTPDVKHKNSTRSSTRSGSNTKFIDKLNSCEKEGTTYGNEVDGGQWQAFQSFLLKDADEAERAVDQGMFSMENGVHVRRRQNAVHDDPLASGGRDVGDYVEGHMPDTQNMSGSLNRITKESNDESLMSRRMVQSSNRRLADGQLDIQSSEMEGRRGVYRRSGKDDFIVHGRDQSGYSGSSSYSLPINGYEYANNGLDQRSPQNMDDDSYVVSLRSSSLDQVGTDGRNAIDMDSEIPSVKRVENLSNRVGSQVEYEPDALSLMPERSAEKGSAGYDPALDYDMEVQAMNKKNKEAAASDIKQGSKKLDKDRKSKLTPDSSDKKKTVGPIRKGKPSKPSPLEEAKARADRLRSFKADLQKMKKEKEEEQRKRVEALKLERQKRIAARGSSIPSQSASQQTRKQLPTKLSPVSHRQSKFSDSEPGSSSPLQRSSIRTVSAGSTDFLKASKPSKLGAGSHSAGNKLSRSASALPEQRKENSSLTPEVKASMARIRRLSEPKISSSHQVSSVKPRNNEPVSKSKISTAPESKKISAIVNHDKSKTASLPELKIRTTKGQNVPQDKSAAKEVPQKANGSKSTTTSRGAVSNRPSDKVSNLSDGDDNPIIEKTVVILECEKPSVPTTQTAGEKTGLQKGHPDNLKLEEKAEMVSDYAAVRAPVSPFTVDEVIREPIGNSLLDQPSTFKATTTENAITGDKGSSKLPSITVAEKPYQAPYARVSSMEDPSTVKSEYGKAVPTSLQAVITGVETVKAHISDPKSLNLEKVPEASEKPQIKESSKGFRRLLKLGRKSHSPGEHNSGSDNVSINGSEPDDGTGNSASSSEVHTLKNLISQDETPTATTTPQKSSRHFSLLSPFRKSSEKKAIA